MPDNRINVTLSQADRTAVMDAINTIRTKLPFLVDLTKEERHTLPKMGDKSRALKVPSSNLKVRALGEKFPAQSLNLQALSANFRVSGQKSRSL